MTLFKQKATCFHFLFLLLFFFFFTATHDFRKQCPKCFTQRYKKRKNNLNVHDAFFFFTFLCHQIIGHLLISLNIFCHFYFPKRFFSLYIYIYFLQILILMFAAIFDFKTFLPFVFRFNILAAFISDF